MSNMTSLGVGSGMPIDQWLDSMEANEKQRLRSLKQKQQKYNQKISAYGSLRAQLDKLQQAAELLMKFDKISATSVSKNHKTVTVSSDEKAVAGSYEVKVEQLAQAQSLATTKVDDVKKKLAGPVTVGQERILVIKQNSEKQPLEIKLSEQQTSLIEIRDAINKTDSNVSASLVKIKEGEHQLVLTAKKTGADSAMEIEVKGDSELNKILNSSQMQQTVAAENAKVTINGIQIEHSSNEIKDAPEGITFTLVKTAEKDKADQLISETVTVTRDIEPTKKAIKNWVDAYNNLHSFYKTQTKYVPTKLGEALSANNGVLLNDSSSAMIFSQVKNLTLNVQNLPDMNHLNHFSIGFNHEGKLTIDDKKLDKTLKDNPAKVKQFFMGDGEKTGFATETFNYLKKTLDTLEGPLHLTTESLNQQIKILDVKMESAQKNIEAKLKTQRDKFIAMDKAISDMKQSSNSLVALLTK
ncbi:MULTISPECIES: flagellar filament capping protein FliD [unclassified Arsenophonus]|uniref:flagellar filament capping protein FliD n=1 Tax=unclassified Arsenophonus TaxID=2627083 RepID=UPI0028602791|nr:flagellar filament capping protein FliD [Arsenophonus sp.]MDR5610207.1 flagellar filament capping protein FliD [Arsenophonus sp.]MDR5614016.1 flagellar filament capping protein FliD [Arsenophonus sp.]